MTVRRPVSTTNLLLALLVAVVTCTTVSSTAKGFNEQQKGSDVIDDNHSETKISMETDVEIKHEPATFDMLKPNIRTDPKNDDPNDPAVTDDDSAEASDDVDTAQESPEQSSADTSSTGNSTDGHATFGDVTSGNNKCVIGKPNEYITPNDLEWVWTHRMAKGVPDFKNYITDQLVSNKGKLSYCVRWDSTEKLSKKVAMKFEAMLNRQYKAWNHWLKAYGCWPFEEIEVTIVGWATRDASLFDWSDDSLGQIYTTEKDEDGVPRCPENCFKHLDCAAASDTSKCEGVPFDQSLWPTLGQGGGAGGDWGQRVDAKNMLDSLDLEELTIISHEVGHGFGLPDFYKPEEQPNEDFPVCLMKAGSAHMVTPADGWLLRRIYEELMPRYNFT
uniref:Neutral zinc metallopeptidase n=1 Tax=Peronospora matthiolae TaxID=2874970 RepID=A0AAV1TJF1_9STRA